MIQVPKITKIDVLESAFADMRSEFTGYEFANSIKNFVGINEHKKIKPLVSRFLKARTEHPSKFVYIKRNIGTQLELKSDKIDRTIDPEIRAIEYLKARGYKIFKSELKEV